MTQLTFALVHGAWHGGWVWDVLVLELTARGHQVVAPDLPCEDPQAGVTEYAAVVTAALGGQTDAVVVGHSLAGLTIPFVPARLRVFLSGRRLSVEPSPAQCMPTGPSAYIVCTADDAIPPDWQRHVARTELGVEPIELDSGHSPMLSCPSELTEILARLAGGRGPSQ